MAQNQNAFLLEWLASIASAFHGIFLLRASFDGYSGNDAALHQAKQFVDARLPTLSVAENLITDDLVDAGKKVWGQLSCLNQPALGETGLNPASARKLVRALSRTSFGLLPSE